MVTPMSNDLWDDPTFGRYKGPQIDGQAQLGRISIANSYASAYAYIDGAIDAADRAVTEQLYRWHRLSHPRALSGTGLIQRHHE